jgi:hypothetical protein
MLQSNLTFSTVVREAGEPVIILDETHTHSLPHQSGVDGGKSAMTSDSALSLLP